MPTFVRFVLVKESFVKVCFSVVVIVMKFNNSPAGNGGKDTIDHFHSQRFVETGGKSLPGNLVQVFIDSADNPDISWQGTNGETTIREKAREEVRIQEL